MRLELNSLDTAKLGQDADKNLGDFETLNIYFGQYLSICFDSISQEYVRYSILREKKLDYVIIIINLTDFYRCINTGAFCLVNMITHLLDYTIK